MKDLREKVIRGGLAKALAQGASLVLRMGSLMVMARLLGPKDFGLVGMVAAFTGVLNLFRDFGLSSATVQRGHVTDDQISTLFFITSPVSSGCRSSWEAPSFSMEPECNTRLYLSGRCALRRWQR